MKKVKALILAIVLFIVTAVVIIVNGSKYTLKVDVSWPVYNIE